MEATTFLKLSDVSRLTGVPQSTLNLYARTGQIRAFKLGKLWRMTEQDVKAMMKYPETAQADAGGAGNTEKI